LRLKKQDQSHHEELQMEREAQALQIKTLKESEIKKYQEMRTRLLNETTGKDSLIKEL